MGIQTMAMEKFLIPTEICMDFKLNANS